MNAIRAIPGIFAAAKASLKSRQTGEHDIDFQRTPNNQLSAELAKLKRAPKLARELVQIVYGESIPVGAGFYPSLVAFAEYLDFSDVAKEIVGIVWAQAFTHLDASQVEAVLIELPSVGQLFSIMLESLPHFVRRQKLSSKTAYRVSTIVAKHIRGKYGPGIDRALETFAENQPTEAIEILSDIAPTDDNCGILSILLGRLRISPHANSVPIAQFEKKFKRSAPLAGREVFYRSWHQEAFSGRLTVDHVNQLCAFADAKGEADVQVVVGLVATWMSTPKLRPPIFRRAFGWLERRVGPTITDFNRMQVAQFASFFNANQYQWPDAWRPNITPLVISILPIAEEHTAIWEMVESYLAALLKTDVPAFQAVMRALGAHNGRTWLKILKKHPGMTELLREMLTMRQDQLIGEFCLSADRTLRHIGLFFFDKLHVPEFPPASLNVTDPRVCWILLHEVAIINSGLNKESAGRCLLSLLSQVGRLGSSFAVALKAELLLQAKNYPGAIGKLFNAAKPGKPILRKVMADQKKYFEALAKTKGSPVLKMQVPGYHRAMEEFARNFYNDVQRGARSHSILMQMAHEVSILYGLSWSTFRGNQLGAPSNLHRVSHESEWPRLELIDPGGMQVRRLHALNQINLLEADIQKNP